MENSFKPKHNNSSVPQISEFLNLSLPRQEEIHTRAKSIDELAINFQTALAGMCGGEVLQTTEYNTSHGTWRDVSLNEGLVRGADQQIIDSVNSKINDKSISPENPLRVLEIGAGSTYPRMEHFGSPWLSRFLANQHQNLIDITCSDVMPSYIGYALFMRVDSNVFFSTIPLSKPAAYSAYENGVFHPLDESNKSKLLSNLKSSHSMGIKIDRLNDATCYCRPSFDADVDKNLFGISSKYKVDYMELATHFPNNKFDLVFSRHLVPKEDLHQISTSTRSILTDNGIGIISIDEGNNSRQDRTRIISKE